ncbi:MAG: acyltransferase [Rubrivivax sp.]
MHLAYIHRTRAVAIVSIVAMHCVDDLDWSHNHQMYRFLVEMFQGATIVFMMISGFLFQHLSKRFEYGHYLKTKFKNVVLPYLFVGLPGVLLVLSKPYFLEQNPELVDASPWAQAAFLYLYGGSQLNHVLWFIPVLTIFYVCAPVFIHFLKRPAWFWSLLVLIPVSVLAHRTTVQKYHHLELAMYFLSAYMSGMVASLYREQVLAVCERYLGWLIAAFLAILLGHFLFTDYVGSYVQQVFSDEQGQIDWIYVQKFLFFFILITVLKKFDRAQLPTLDHLATVSFAIFFLHVYVLHVYSHFTHWHPFPGTALNTLALVVLVLSVSTALAQLTRRIFGRSSRLLIGA